MQKSIDDRSTTDDADEVKNAFFFADIECPEFDISDVHLESRMDGRKIGARVHFSCPRGFDLKGQNGLVCQKNGKLPYI